jgi:transcriptional regulator with XRE-family HTH domain
MLKSTLSPEYEFVKQTLIRIRNEAGLTQRDLANRMGREQSFIWRIETGERRIDIIEFAWLCKAVGKDPTMVYATIMTHLQNGPESEE